MENRKSRRSRLSWLAPVVLLAAGGIAYAAMSTYTAA